MTAMRKTFPITVAFLLVLAVIFPEVIRAQDGVQTLPPDLAPLNTLDPGLNMALGGGKAEAGGADFFTFDCNPEPVVHGIGDSEYFEVRDDSAQRCAVADDR